MGELDDDDDVAGVNCERAFLEALDGNCKTPIAGSARVIDGKIKFRGLIPMPDGTSKFEIESEGEVVDAKKIGREAGEAVKAQAGKKFFDMSNMPCCQVMELRPVQTLEYESSRQ